MIGHKVPDSTKLCYACDAHLSIQESIRIANRLDALNEVQHDLVTDALNLVHCIGPDEYYLKDGRVVICRNCLSKSI